jgi:hypothetical protein
MRSVPVGPETRRSQPVQVRGLPVVTGIAIRSKSLSALGALEEVERGRRDTVVLSDR